MPKYIVDANLPQTFNLWQTEDFVYAVQLGIEKDDNFIWDYAQENALTILSRDIDFADRCIHSSPPPRVIHFRIGNMRFADFRIFMQENWDKINFYSLNYKLVIIYPDYIEGIK